MGAATQGEQRRLAHASGQTASENATSMSQRRTFKDKLHHLIQEAEAAEIKAYREQQSQDKSSLCISLLTEGQPHAFVDFFCLTHGLVATDTVQTVDDKPQREELLPESIVLLKAQLAKAESAQRVGETEQIYETYRYLGRYFSQLQKPKKSIFFYQKCLQIAKDTHWLDGELDASFELGLVYEGTKEAQLAISCHERCLEIATLQDRAAETEAAYHSLTSVYAQKAAELELAGDLDASIECLQKCLYAATSARDNVAAAAVNYQLGTLVQLQGKWSEASDYHRSFMLLSRQNADPGAEGKGYCALAVSQQKLGDLDGAVNSLETYLELCRSNDPKGQAIASCNLGIILFQQQKLEQALTYFEKSFELARTLHDRKVIDAARINLGVARGVVRTAAFMQLVTTDMNGIIQWKNIRMPFSDQ